MGFLSKIGSIGGKIFKATNVISGAILKTLPGGKELEEIRQNTTGGFINKLTGATSSSVRAAASRIHPTGGGLQIIKPEQGSSDGESFFGASKDKLIMIGLAVLAVILAVVAFFKPKRRRR